MSPLQSVKIFGFWDQPRRIVMWDDFKTLNLTWHTLRTEYGFTTQQLHTIQSDKREWIIRGGITLHDLEEMSIFPINPFSDLNADLAEVWSMQWSVHELAAMNVTFDQFVDRGITADIVRCFNFPLSAWCELGLKPGHIHNETMARAFGLPYADLVKILEDHALSNDKLQ